MRSYDNFRCAVRVGVVEQLRRNVKNIGADSPAAHPFCRITCADIMAWILLVEIDPLSTSSSPSPVVRIIPSG